MDPAWQITARRPSREAIGGFHAFLTVYSCRARVREPKLC